MSWSSFELKRNYQWFLGLSTGIAVLFYVAVGVGISVFTGFQDPPSEPIRIRKLASFMVPPIRIVEESEPMGVSVVEGRPVPVPKAQELKVQIGSQPYRGDVYGIVPDLTLLNVGGSIDNGGIEIRGLSTLKMKLVETDRLPECFHVVLPGYPDSAKANNIEARVYFFILIDREGNVREVVAKSSKPGWGFTKATVDAVREWQYRPAISANVKVAVRVAYEFWFKIKQS